MLHLAAILLHHRKGEKKQLKLLGNTEACIDEAVNKWILNK